MPFSHEDRRLDLALAFAGYTEERDGFEADSPVDTSVIDTLSLPDQLEGLRLLLLERRLVKTAARMDDCHKTLLRELREQAAREQWPSAASRREDLPTGRVLGLWRRR